MATYGRRLEQCLWADRPSSMPRDRGGEREAEDEGGPVIPGQRVQRCIAQPLLEDDDAKRIADKARKDKRAGKAPTTQAGEFVREEIDKIRRGETEPEHRSK